MILNTDLINSILRPGLCAVFGKQSDYPSQWSDIFDSLSSYDFEKEISKFFGFGISENITKSLINSMMNTKEMIASNVLNNGFLTYDNSKSKTQIFIDEAWVDWNKNYKEEKPYSFESELNKLN